jgi:hypothetical protein
MKVAAYYIVVTAKSLIELASEGMQHHSNLQACKLQVERGSRSDNSE